MRPPGEVRAALREVFALHGAAATWQDVMQPLAERGVVGLLAPAEVRMVRATIKNMVKAGELRPAGLVQVPGSLRWQAVYVPAGRLATGAGRSGNFATRWGGSNHGQN